MFGQCHLQAVVFFLSNAFLSNPEMLPCNYDWSSYADKHKHIVAVDLCTIKNSVLRKLFTKGP